jgi:3-phosphoshikimate 1-carboxyvinyltransferase
VGLAAEQSGLSTDPTALADPTQAEKVAQAARHMRIAFSDGKVWLDGTDVTQALREERAGMAASRVSSLPAVREALLQVQHACRALPGLVADGRDMGTVIFPDAQLKVFLTASAETRAERRHAQLISRGEKATIDNLLQALKARDAQDMSRAHAPLKPAEDALLLDNSLQTFDESVAQVLAWWQGKQAF